jgi:O-acetylhomoserine/O-acetylserine sulfhydrylase-like pyridoxal-dependent enzyme
VQEPWDLESWKKQIDGNTRFVYGEMPSNPQQACFDIAEVAKLAHAHGLPLIVDATVATPALMRPLAHGADIVVHSITKTVGSGGFSIGGAIITKEGITSRHLAEEVKKDFAVWMKLWPFRDSGPCMSPWSAFLFMNDLRTLRSKMKQYSESTMKIALYLAKHPKVEKVDYLGLPEDPLHGLAKKYMAVVDDGAPAFGHLMSFNIRGDAKQTRKFFDGMQMVFRATDLGRIKCVATIPGISTHQQQGEEGRKLAGIPMNMVRLCVGGEHPDDILADLDQALGKI